MHVRSDVQFRRRSQRRRSPTGEGWLILPLLFFTVLTTAKLWATRVALLGDANPIHALLVEGGFVLVLMSLVALLPRGRVWAWLGIDLLVSIVCVAVFMYTAQFYDVPTLSALGIAGELGGVKESVYALFSPSYLWFFADIDVLAGVFVLVPPFAGR